MHLCQHAVTGPEPHDSRELLVEPKSETADHMGGGHPRWQQGLQMRHKIGNKIFGLKRGHEDEEKA